MYHQPAQYLMKEKQVKIAEFQQQQELNENQVCHKDSFLPNIHKDKEMFYIQTKFQLGITMNDSRQNQQINNRIEKTPFYPQINGNQFKLICQSQTSQCSNSSNSKQQYTPRFLGNQHQEQCNKLMNFTQTTTPLQQKYDISYHKPIISMINITVNQKILARKVYYLYKI